MVFARVDEALDGLSLFGIGREDDPFAIALKDARLAQVIYFGRRLFGMPTQTRGQFDVVDLGAGVAFEVDDDVPRQQAADVAIDELSD